MVGRGVLNVINVVVLVCFALDYAVGFALTSSRRQYVRDEWASLLIVLAQAPRVRTRPRWPRRPPGLSRRATATVIAVTVRVLAIGGAARAKGREKLRREAGNPALGVAALTWISSAVAFTLDEDVGDGLRIPSFFDALWSSSATITTVGYGDILPVTTAGHLVGIVTMFVGISAFVVVSAKIAEWLVTARSDEANLTAKGPERPEPVVAPTAEG